MRGLRCGLALLSTMLLVTIAAVAQEVTDGLERRALAQEVHRQGVTDTVRSLKGNRESAPIYPALKGLGQGRGLELSGRGSGTEEDLASREAGAIPPDVLQDRRAHRRGQREQKR